MVEKSASKSTDKKRNKGQKSHVKRKASDRQTRANLDRNVAPAVSATNDFHLHKRAAFLKGLYDGKRPTKICQEIGISRSWVYDLRRRDNEFAAAWDRALEEGHLYRQDVLEETLFERVVNGIKEQKMKYAALVDPDGHLKEVPVERIESIRHDTQLLLRALEAEKPAKYRQKIKADDDRAPDDKITEMIQRIQGSETSGLASLVKP